jgi:hypothetical protein
VDYNKSTGAYKVTVTATVESQINDQLAMNLWILEDGVVGSGSGWDQHNYLSKTGGAPDPNSKYYDLPPVITGFVHNNVFRHATGGITGDITPFASVPVAPGTYTKVYEGNVSQYNILDKNRVFFVGLVQNTATKEIINAERVGKVVPDTDQLTASIDDKYVSLPDNNKKEVEITLTNEKAWTVKADLAVNTETSVIPSGWGLTLSNSTITVNANSSRTIKLEILKNNIEGFAAIDIDVKPQKSKPENAVSNSKATLYVMTENIENAFLYGYDDANAQILTAIANSGVLSKVTPVWAAPEIVSNFPQMANFKTAILTVSDGSIGFSNSQTALNMNLLNTLMDNGCDVLITSVLDLINYGGKVSGTAPTAEATTFFRNRLGVEYSRFFGLVNGNQLSGLPITGVSGDDISSGITFMLNEAYSSSYQHYARYATCFSLNGNTNAIPFLEVSNPTSQQLTTQNNKIGIKLDNAGQRTIFVCIPFDPVNNPNRDLLFKNMLTWLKGEGTQAMGPKISLNATQVTFSKTEIGKTETKVVSITNDGDEKLTVSEINFKYGTYFSADAGALPLNIDAGQTVNLNITFAPTEAISYQDEITLVSNDKTNPSVVISLAGTGDTPSSVPGEISNVFKMTVTPNPVVSSSVVEFTNLKGSTKVNIDLIDATGKVVNSLFNGATTGASVGLNANELSSGTYFIRANVDGKTTQLPVIITK